MPLTAYADYYDDDYEDEPTYVSDANEELTVDYVYYGDRTIYGSSYTNSKITLYYGNKTYKTVSDSDGYFTFSVPVKKIGTKIKVKAESAKDYSDEDYEGVTYVNTKIYNNKPYCENDNFFQNQKSFKGLVKNAHRGDVVFVKIGKKTYKKKVKKDRAKFKYSFKVKKKYKYGTKIKITVKNKYKQKLTSYSDVVYYAKKPKKGMTMKQAKCMPGWTSPDRYENYDYGTFWYYDDDDDGDAYDSYLFFDSRNRLDGWGY